MQLQITTHFWCLNTVFFSSFISLLFEGIKTGKVLKVAIQKLTYPQQKLEQPYFYEFSSLPIMENIYTKKKQIISKLAAATTGIHTAYSVHRDQHTHIHINTHKKNHHTKFRFCNFYQCIKYFRLYFAYFSSVVCSK